MYETIDTIYERNYRHKQKRMQTLETIYNYHVQERSKVSVCIPTY